MPLGNTAFVIECRTNGAYIESVPPCVDIGGQFYQPVIVESYLLDASAQSYIEGMAEPFDYGSASYLFAFGFTGVFLLWWLGLVAGKIIQAIWD